ncbi:phosphoesterase [Streptomyces sp. AS58]|nr:phosphoesterase [Streptomyces sp. AS58]
MLQQRRAGFGDAAAHGIPTHVTLLPPTEVGEPDLAVIEAHLGAVAAAGRPFAMRLSGTGTFRPLSPVVFVQVVEGAEACAGLQQQVRDPSGPLARELQFPYHPHVTVAHGIADEAMDRAYAELADYRAEWACTGFGLYEQGADAVWRKLRDFTFGGAVVPPQAAHVERGTIPSR